MKRTLKSIYDQQYRVVIKRLKLARIEADLTQAQVGEAFGRNHTFISKIESCERRVDIGELLFFADLYKKPLGFFFDNLNEKS